MTNGRTIQSGSGKTGNLPGESVKKYISKAHLAYAKSLKSTVLHVMNVAPSPDYSGAGLYATDIVDEVLGALLEFTDCDMVVERILAREDLTTDLHERMTRDI